MMARNNQKIDHAIEFKIDDSLLVRRICGRLVHPLSGRTYHEEFHPPKTPGRDDVTGEPLVRRSDDNEATLRKRLETYHAQTAPVIGYYRRKGIWSSLDASLPPPSVWAALLATIKKGRPC